MRYATRCVQFDSAPGDPAAPSSTPIYQTATFRQESALQFGDYDYSRSGNPTRAVLEDQLARLEHASRAFAFTSGMAAISAVSRLVRSGDEILIGDDLYGGTHRLLAELGSQSGVAVRAVDTTDPVAVDSAITKRTRLVFLETPTNPLQRVTDLVALSEVMHERGVLLAVDNTLLSPYLQNPLLLGADIVIHSATKHLSGHGDVTAGCIAVNDAELAERLAWVQNSEGAALGPFDSWLLLRGLKTLALRLERQQTNATRIARYLSEHPLIDRVHYAGLAEHPGSEIIRRTTRGGGCVISFETGSLEFSRRMAESVQLFGLAVSFGSVNSTISLPCFSYMTKNTNTKS